MPPPDELAWLAAAPGGAAWLDRLDDLLGRAAWRWGLRVGPPYPSSHVSYTAPATTGSGHEVVVKLQFPHDECRHEAAALRAWDGTGAVHLLDHDPADHALLLERCIPGTHLADDPAADHVEVLAGLIEQLAAPAAEPFTPLDREAAGWVARLPARWERAGRPFDARLVDAAVRLVGELTPVPGPAVLLHQDLHADNVLAATRVPWLAIDPKPLVGEPAFAVAPVVRAYELGHGRAAVLARLDRLVERLDLDAQRAAAWSFVQTLAWSIDERGALPRHVETAGWLLDRLDGR